MSPTALYIRRAELHHTKEYISKALEFNMYGIVKEVQFIAKSSGTVAYNGVIVIFDVELTFGTPGNTQVLTNFPSK